MAKFRYFDQSFLFLFVFTENSFIFIILSQMNADVMCILWMTPVQSSVLFHYQSGLQQTFLQIVQKEDWMWKMRSDSVATAGRIVDNYILPNSDTGILRD